MTGQKTNRKQTEISPALPWQVRHNPLQAGISLTDLFGSNSLLLHGKNLLFQV
jgi:hypothetical protein